jgi:hypothetical protein
MRPIGSLTRRPKGSISNETGSLTSSPFFGINSHLF